MKFWILKTEHHHASHDVRWERVSRDRRECFLVPDGRQCRQETGGSAAVRRRSGESPGGTVPRYRLGQFKEGQRNFIDPVVGRGTQAGNSLLELITSGGKTMGGKNVSDLLQESDLFKFESNLGQRDINRQLKARGMYNSGSGHEALGRFETELMAKEGQRWYDRTIGGLTELSRQGLAAGQSGMQGITSLGGATMSLGRKRRGP